MNRPGQIPTYRSAGEVSGVAHATKEFRILILALTQAEKRGYQPVKGWDKGRVDWFDIISSHDFARAFWDDGQRVVTKTGVVWKFDGKVSDLRRWEFQLQQMVLYENPFEYLERFIEEVGHE